MFDFVVLRGIRQENISWARVKIFFCFESVIIRFNGLKRLAVRILKCKPRTIRMVDIILINKGRQKNITNSNGG
jgi:hypothetical protein